MFDFNHGKRIYLPGAGVQGTPAVGASVFRGANIASRAAAGVLFAGWGNAEVNLAIAKSKIIEEPPIMMAIWWLRSGLKISRIEDEPFLGGKFVLLIV
jgi:hypothetical protein